QQENCDTNNFYHTIQQVRGIGSASAQKLMLIGEVPDAFFLSTKGKGIEKGYRRWIALTYGADPYTISDEDFQQLIKNWQEYEGAAMEFLFADWILSQKEKQQSEN